MKIEPFNPKEFDIYVSSRISELYNTKGYVKPTVDDIRMMLFLLENIDKIPASPNVVIDLIDKFTAFSDNHENMNPIDLLNHFNPKKQREIWGADAYVGLDYLMQSYSYCVRHMNMVKSRIAYRRMDKENE